MLGEYDTAEQEKLDKRYFHLGYTVLIILFLIAIFLIGNRIINQATNQLQYPGSIQLSNHRIHRYYPPRIREDFSFVTNDSYHDVFRWYSRKFNLGSEAGASERCSVLHGSTPSKKMGMEITVNVTVCDLNPEKRIYVTRFINLP